MWLGRSRFTQRPVAIMPKWRAFLSSGGVKGLRGADKWGWLGGVTRAFQSVLVCIHPAMWGLRCL